MDCTFRTVFKLPCKAGAIWGPVSCSRTLCIWTGEGKDQLANPKIMVDPPLPPVPQPLLSLSYFNISMAPFKVTPNKSTKYAPRGP